MSAPTLLIPHLPDELVTCEPLPAPPKKRIYQAPGQPDRWVTYGSQLNDWIADVIEAHDDCRGKLTEIRKLMEAQPDARPRMP